MGDRRYGEGFRGRSPSPRRPMPRSRVFNNSRHRRFSPYRVEKEEYSRDVERSRRAERRGQYDRDFDVGGPRCSDYENRDRDRYAVDARWSRSLPRIDKRDNFDRETARLPYYDVGGRHKYRNNISIGSSRVPYHKDSYRGLSLVKSQSDRLLDGPRKSPVNARDYGSVPGDYGVGNNNLVRGGGERDDYWRDQYPDSSQPGFLPSSQYLENDKSLYEGGGRTHSHSYMMAHDGVDDMRRNNLSNGDGRSSGISSMALRYMNSGTDRPEYSRFPGELELDERDGVYGDREILYFDKKTDGFRFLDDALGRKKVGGETENIKEEGTLLSSQGYFKADSDYLVSSSQHKDYVLESSYWPKDYLPESSYRPKNYVPESSYRPKNYVPELSSRPKDYVPEPSYWPKDYVPESSSQSKEYVVESSSRPKDYIPASYGSLREGFQRYTAVGEIHMPSYDIRSGSRLTPEPILFHGYSEEKSNMSPQGPGGQRSYLALTEGGPVDELYTEFGRGKIEFPGSSNIEEQDREKHVRRVDVLNPTIDESSRSKYTRSDELWDPSHISLSGSTSHKFDDCGPLLIRKQDPDMLGAGSSCFSYGTEGFHQNSSILPDEHHADVGGALQSNDETLDILQPRTYDPSYGGVYGSPRQRFTLGDLSLAEPSNRRLGQKEVSEEVLYEHSLGIKISTDGNGSRKIYNQVDKEDEFGIVKFSKKPESSKSNYQGTLMESREIVNIRPPSSKSALSDSAKPDARDIKMRLGPVSHNLHVSHRLMKKKKPSIKKRLQPTHPKKHATLPWLKSRGSNRTSVTDDSDVTLHDQEGDYTRDRDSLANPEPPEKSEDFKQMVQSAFFKFLKEINETSMKRKKYKEQGKAGSLKCIVCSSNSKEFVDTESLAMHALTSEKSGVRSQHLGLHRALCMVMGWKFTGGTSSEWHREVMSNDEVSALEEDLIVWPPVVIVQNCTIDSKNPDERVIVTTEKLSMKLKEMGFGNILKVCSGKPANQSVMLVKFNGTLSGLQEALSYHRSYLESKHGRGELKQLNSKAGRTHSDLKEENILYGYLGLVEDLDKLDFDTKKRCVLRSKKEILSIAEA